MREQEWILKNIDSFEPKDIFECGQCFRWNKEEDGSYTGIFQKNIINVNKEKDVVYFQGICEGDIQELVEKYFDLKRDYKIIKRKLEKVDSSMRKGIQYGQGIRLLNQDLWETMISFIISANNNIPRIKGIIERLAIHYGEKILWKDKEYYTFPTPEQLAKVTIEDYRELGAGFRDKRLFETTQMVLTGKLNLQELEKNPNTEEVKQILLNVPGVGPKVADCILLFSTLKRLEVFPIDVWVRRVMNELYIKEEVEEKVSRQRIEKIAQEKFGDLAGIAQQYLFYWKRDAS